jgi:hypothetical protein
MRTAAQQVDETDGGGLMVRACERSIRIVVASRAAVAYRSSVRPHDGGISLSILDTPWFQLLLVAALIALLVLEIHFFRRLFPITAGFPKGSSDRDDFAELQSSVPALWGKLIDQATQESDQHQSYRYWLPTLRRLGETDAELFHYLSRRLPRSEHRRLNQYLYGTGVLDLVRELESGTETTLLVRGVKKVNGALDTWLDNSSRLWPGKGAVRSFLQTKNDLLGNLLEARSEEA